MNATPVSKRELVRLLVIEHGQKRAAELSGEPYEKVRKWTQRGNWLASQSVPTSQIIDRVASELEQDERETRLSLSRAARQMAKDCETLPVKHSDKALNVGKLAGITHKWDAKQGSQANVMVNVAILGIDPDEVRAEADIIDQA